MLTMIEPAVFVEGVDRMLGLVASHPCGVEELKGLGELDKNKLRSTVLA